MGPIFDLTRQVRSQDRHSFGEKRPVCLQFEFRVTAAVKLRKTCVQL